MLAWYPSSWAASRCSLAVGQHSAALLMPALCLGWHVALLQDYLLPPNVNATTSAAEAIAGAQFAIHAVPVQHTRAFLQGIKARWPCCLPLLQCICHAVHAFQQPASSSRVLRSCALHSTTAAARISLAAAASTGSVVQHGMAWIV